MTQTEEFEFKTLESVWVSCPYPVLALGLEKMSSCNKFGEETGQGVLFGGRFLRW
jgi:hypothetical protein